MDVSKRWLVSKTEKLCYGCLGDDHIGQKIRGVDRVGSMDVKRLLHRSRNDNMDQQESIDKRKNSKPFENIRSEETVKSTPDITTEGPERQNRTINDRKRP